MSTSGERDQSIERLLQSAFRQPETGVTEACLDAETIAALSDGGLAGDALEMARSHLADCARCQAIVGTAARVRTIAREPEPERAARRWLAWVVPLTAATAALAIWVAAPRAPDVVAPSRQLETRNEAPQAKAEPPTGVVPPATQPEKERQQAGARKNDQPARDAASPLLRKDADAQEVDRLREQSPRSAGAGLADQATASAQAAPPAAPPAATAPVPARREAVEAPPAANAAEKVTALSAQAAAARWRIADGRLEQSRDGATWAPVATASTSPLTALSSPSPTVCWVVGRAGVILRTTDGQNFSRIQFPSTSDLTGVEATSAQAAKVSTADGRTFSTTDGGTIWR